MTEDCLSTSQIRIDGGTQPREAINQEYVIELADAIANGAELPPIDVFNDGVAYWLADGFHRYFAHQKVDKPVRCRIHVGLQREAVLFSVGANAGHGLRRTNADKQKAVRTLLADKEWSQWTNGEIARRCSVSDMMVIRVRKSISNNVGDRSTRATRSKRKATRNGKAYDIDTTNIGKRKTFPSVPASPSASTAPATQPTPTPTPEPTVNPEPTQGGEQPKHQAEPPALPKMIREAVKTMDKLQKMLASNCPCLPELRDAYNAAREAVLHVFSEIE